MTIVWTLTLASLVSLMSLRSVEAVTSQTIHCDIVVAGGSTAALAAGIAAARDNHALRLCLTEPTDWLGGQLTSAGVPAIDYGHKNRESGFQPSDWEALIASLGAGNPANCWVSTKCFLPENLVSGWISRTVSGLSNLRVLYNTVIKRVHRQGRVISALDAVQRHPVGDQWSRLLSQTVEDWYSEQDSSLSTKTLIRLEGAASLVVIEATEWGDVLALSGASYHQGAETPSESSTHFLDECGQAFTIPFFIQNGGANPHIDTSSGSQGPFDLESKPWGQIWSYRRVKHVSGAYHASSPGDISNQNWGGGNDYKDQYFFLAKSATQAQTSDWKGGINMAALRAAEKRAYGWFNYYVSVAPSDVRNSLHLSTAETGTRTGLTKIPYLRDTRRSVGLDGYQLQKADFDASISGQYGPRYSDSIALGDYLYADVHFSRHCALPAYLNARDIKPFYIPFRSLTNNDLDNVLVAGKTMAVSFQANAATRMHPMEWNTGLAAGLAASIMADDRMTSRQMHAQVNRLQAKLLAFTTLDWNHSRH